MWPDASARQEFQLAPLLFWHYSTSATYYFTINPRLFPYRYALLPITFASIWNLCTNYYYPNPWFNAFNFTNCIAGVAFSMKLVDIAMMSEPPRYDGKVACTRSDVVCWNCFQNMVSYNFDMRCLHWHNESTCHRPRDSRPDSTHFQFYASTLFHFLKHLFYFDTAQAVIANMSTHGLPQGDTIFRDTLALTSNYVIRLPHPMFVAIPAALFGGLSVMNILAAGHYFCTLLAAPLVWLPRSISPYHLPASSLKKEWPPLFDGPLDATSVRDFWSHRWHALFRRTFMIAGGKPGATIGEYLGGIAESLVGAKGKDGTAKPIRKLGMKMGAVMGVFLASGLMHDWGAWGVGRGTEYQSITAFFVLQGVIVIVEEALELTKVKQLAKPNGNGVAVNGNGVVIHENEKYEQGSDAWNYFMKLWTFFWVVVPATFMLDAWLRRGVTCVSFVPYSLSPARAVLGVWNRFAYDE